MHEMIKRLEYIFHLHEPISLISIFISFVLFSIICQGSFYPANAEMRKTFTPRISIYGQHDDNIDMISNLDLAMLDKKSDWVTMISPGFLLNLDSPKTKLSLNYETRFSFHNRYSSEDTILQNGSTQWAQELTRNIKLDVRDTFSRSDDPILESEEGLLEEVTGRRIYYRNNGQVSLSMGLDVYNSIGFGYRNLYLHNTSGNYEDSVSDEFFFNLDSKPNPFLGIDLESRINRGRFTQPKEFTGSGTEDFYDREGVITLNYRWHPSRSLFARYSLLAKKYDDPNIAEFWLHQGSAGINFILSPHTNFSVEGGYFLQNFAGSRESDEDGARFNIVLNTKKKKSTVRIGGSGGFAQDYFSSENRGSSKFKQVFGSLNYLLSKDLSTFFSADYQLKNFLEKNQGNREEKIWRTSGGFYFSFSDWLTLSIEGSHSERRSESDLVYNRHPEFIRDNRVMLRLTAAYPIRF